MLFSACVSPVVSYNEYAVLDYVASQRPNPDPDDDAAIKQRFKAEFIKNIYLDNVFNASMMYYSDSSESDYTIITEMIKDQFADYLADSDVIDLSSIRIDE